MNGRSFNLPMRNLNKGERVYMEVNGFCFNLPMRNLNENLNNGELVFGIVLICQ